MLPTTTKEQREPMYEDLVPLVVPGFLTSRLQIGGLTLGLRSLSLTDTNLLRKVAHEGGPNWAFQLAAASIWMIDGLSLLESYPYSQKIAFTALQRAHKSVVRAVFAQALSFFRRMRDVNRVFEAFLYEDESRRLWKATNNGMHPIWTHVGMPGLDRLGMNPFQSSWVQWNRSEDDRLDDDYSWSLTKVLVSVQSSKSAKKLDAKDRTRLEAEKSRRAEVQNRAYYTFKGLLDEEGKETVHPILQVLQPHTAAELSEEMRRWVVGEKDFHDLVIDDYKNRIKTEFEAKEQESELVLRQARERAVREESQLGVPKPRLVGYTADQLAKLRPSQGKPGAKFIIEASMTSRNFNRYLRDRPDPGALDVAGGKIVVKNHSQEEDAPPTLNDLISNRKSILNGG
jgi:hypothetical protein